MNQVPEYHTENPKPQCLGKKMVNRKENYFDYYYSKKEGHNLSK